MKDQFRIVRLEAENIKRLKAVSLDPDGNVIEITGRNGAGKSSLLDSIFFALAGTGEIPATPIRKGQDKAKITVNLGSLIITRRFNLQDNGDYTTSLIVETPEGARFQSPQNILNNLVGELTFDPLAFTRMKARDQFEALKRFVPDFDFEATRRLADEKFGERTDVNRDAKQLRARQAAIIIPADVPEASVDENELLAELERAGHHNAAIERQKADLVSGRADVDALRVEIERRERDIERTRRQIASLQAAIGEYEEANAIDAKRLAAEMERLDAITLPPAIDAFPIRDKIEKAREANQLVARRAERDKIGAEADALEQRSEALTKELAEIETLKRGAIAAAKMPVPGIGFGNGFITLDDLPFEQASSAEQLRASIAIAMAMNPKLRILLVRDGALLDEDSMKIVQEMAAEQGCQVWIETVASDRPGAVVIEEGEIVEQEA